MHKRLVDTSRQAGMAEVATSVLHNVGNVLNSVNISATLVADGSENRNVDNLGKVVALLQEHGGPRHIYDKRPQGQTIARLIFAQLAEHLIAGTGDCSQELDSLRKQHRSHQGHRGHAAELRKISGVMEMIEVADLVEDACA